MHTVPQAVYQSDEWCCYILYKSLVAKYTVKPVLNGHSKRRSKIGFQDQLSLNAGQKYCRMLQAEHSALLLTFIKLPYSHNTLFCLFLSGRLRQVLLYINFHS